MLELIKQAKKKIAEAFDLSISKSTLYLYTPDEWVNFAESHGKNPGTLRGLYLPNEYSAHVTTGKRHYPLTVFHELFGHGLFYECSVLGKNSKSAKPSCLKSFGGDTQEYLEGIAVWFDQWCSYQLGLKAAWHEKFLCLPKSYKLAYTAIKNQVEEQTAFGMLAHHGFEIPVTQERLANYIQATEPGTQFAIQYGDGSITEGTCVFVLGDETRTTTNSWLKLQMLSPSDFARVAAKQHPDILSTMFQGRFLCGDRTKYNKVKEKLRIAL